MKNIIILIWLSITIACQSQNIKNMTPTVDNQFERYNTSIFDKIIIENNLIKRGYLNNNYTEIYFSKETSKITLETSEHSYFSIYKEYYTNDNIKLKGLRSNNNNFRDPFNKGIWYEFDEKGKLIKEKNYDEPYKFTFEDILDFCKNENIKVDKGPVLQSTGYHTTIRRDVENGKPWWEIRWLKTPDTIETIKLDGETGKVLSRTEQHYTNN